VQRYYLFAFERLDAITAGKGWVKHDMKTTTKLVLPPSGSHRASGIRVVGDFSTRQGSVPVPPSRVHHQQQSAPVAEYVWRDPATGSIEQPPSQPPAAVVAEANREATTWLWFWLFLGIIFLVIFVAAIAWPYGGRWYAPEGHGGWPGKDPSNVPPPALGGTGTDTRDDCTADELYNEDAKLCIMRSYFPQAVSPAIMDASVSPCTDIYRHACGKWIDSHTNENRGFAGLVALNSLAIRGIVLNKSVANLNPFYQSCEATLVLDPGRRRQRELNQMDSKLTREAILGRMLDPLVSHADLPLVFARMTAAGYTVPIALAVQGNPMDKGVIPLFMYDGFQGREHEPEWVRLHFEALYGEGSDQARFETNALLDMVAKVDVHEPDRSGALETYEGWKTYVTGNQVRSDMMTWSEFQSLSRSTFDWNLYLGEVEKRLSLPAFKFAPTQTVWALSRSFFEWFMPESFSVSEWRTYITFSVLYHTHDFFPELPADVLLSGRRLNVVSPLRAAHRRFKKRPLSAAAYGHGPRTKVRHTHAKGQEWVKRSRRTSSKQPKYARTALATGADDTGLVVSSADCLAATQFMLPGILSKEFLATRFKDGEQTRARVQTMVERIRDRFVLNIERTTWMDNATRTAQVAKVKAIVPRVVHPTEWSEEVFPLGKEMDPVRYLRNLGIIQEERVRRNLALWSESNYGVKCDARCRDRITLFGAPLFTVNAWYNPDRNVITIPAGILQPPFYHPQFTDASAYGTIGWVVAHELSHSEDDHGILYDADGVMRPTWTADALTEYRKRATCLVNEYSTLEDCNADAYGEQTLCENVADNNGVRIAYEALFDDPATRHLHTLEDKREFILAGAQMWCASYQPQVLCDSARDDVHAAALMRVRKTFAQLPYFAEVMGCNVGDPMHRHAKERCELFGP